jgi:hypothetical protein
MKGGREGVVIYVGISWDAYRRGRRRKKREKRDAGAEEEAVI